MTIRALPLAMTALMMASPLPCAAGEVESLRARCAEQERQIRELEEENARLREITGATAKSPVRPGAEESAKATKKPESSEKAPPKPAAEQAGTAVRTYKVKQGDTYYGISKRYGIPVATLQAANPTIKATALRPGLIIKLGKGSAAPATGTASAPVPKSTAAPQTPPPTPPPLPFKPTSPVVAPPPSAKDRSASAPATSTKNFKLPRPTRFDEVATRYGTTVERLNSLNNLNLPDTILLAEGTELLVPAQP